MPIKNVVFESNVSLSILGKICRKENALKPLAPNFCANCFSEVLNVSLEMFKYCTTPRSFVSVLTGDNFTLIDLFTLQELINETARNIIKNSGKYSLKFF